MIVVTTLDGKPLYRTAYPGKAYRFIKTREAHGKQCTWHVETS